jgi:predicted nucleic acid-binding protein
MPPVLFDTSIYITLFRARKDAALQARRMAAGAPVWLSAGGVGTLYAGGNGKSRKVLQRLERDFDRVKRILLPNLSDWTQTGKALARLAAKHDYEQIGRGRLTNDAFIATSAGRLSVTVITAHAGDFSKFAEFLRFAWRVESVV